MSKKIKQKKYNKQRAESRIQAYADQIGSSVKMAAEDPRGYTVVLTDEEIRHLNEVQSETNEEITMMDSIKNVANEKVAQTKTFTKSTAVKAKDGVMSVASFIGKQVRAFRTYTKANKVARDGAFAVTALILTVSMLGNPAAWAAASSIAVAKTLLLLVAYAEVAAYAVYFFGNSKTETVSVH